MNKSYNTNIAFLDLLFNTLLCFAALFAISFVLINPVKENKKIDVNADFLITVSWPEDMHDDIDVYIQDPQGEIVYYGKKESELIHLDRDDLGQDGDSVETEFGLIEYRDNREILTVRKAMQGEYIVNIHVYSKRASSTTPVTVQVDKINPFSTVFLKTFDTTFSKEELTACRFTLNEDLEIKSITRTPYKLVNKVGSRAWGL